MDEILVTRDVDTSCTCGNEMMMGGILTLMVTPECVGSVLCMCYDDVGGHRFNWATSQEGLGVGVWGRDVL
jgi:hypothetical protein